MHGLLKLVRIMPHAYSAVQSTYEVIVSPAPGVRVLVDGTGVREASGHPDC